MGIESATEQALKTALRVFTDTLTGDAAVTYRCFFLDDETATGETREARNYPLLEITASPGIPRFHKSVFKDVPVTIRWATRRFEDPKRATLKTMYEGCRTILDNETGVSVSGYHLQGVVILDGESNVEDDEFYIRLGVSVRLCDAS